MTADASQQVEILLACYNGQKYLPQLLDSIAAQSCDSWRLSVRDDGSTDNTGYIISEFAGRFPGRVNLVSDSRGNLGPGGNFAALLDGASGDYIMFADQDDVWLPDKIFRSLEAMRLLQQSAGADVPLLVHSDLKVVDGELNPLADSLWSYQKIDAREKSLARLLVANNVTGCATMINSALAQLAAPVAAEAVMHDWWLALVAAAFGRIAAIDSAEILYRQHGANDVGAAAFGAGFIAGRLRKFFGAAGLAQRLKNAQRQAAAFADRYGDKLNADQYALVMAYATIGEKSFIARRAELFRHGLWMHGRGLMPLVKNIGLLLRI